MSAGKPSKLERLSIGFEFNESWADARKHRQIKATTTKKKRNTGRR